MGNFTSRLYNEEGYKYRSYCRRKVLLFMDSDVLLHHKVDQKKNRIISITSTVQMLICNQCCNSESKSF